MIGSYNPSLGCFGVCVVQGLRYWFSYCTGPVDCDTEIFTFGGAMQQPLMQQPIMQQPIIAQPLQAPQSGYGQAQAQPQPLFQQPVVAPLSPASRAPGAQCPGTVLRCSPKSPTYLLCVVWVGV